LSPAFSRGKTRHVRRWLEDSKIEDRESLSSILAFE
jgi:hypothetical protein